MHGKVHTPMCVMGKEWVAEETKKNDNQLPF